MFGAVPISLLLEINSANGKYVQESLPLDLAPEFDLPMEYFTDIPAGFTYMVGNSMSPTTMTRFINHPGFEELRNMLERSGHLEVVRNCANGDTVLKRFRLNTLWFEAGDRFLCAAAMKYRINND